LELDSLADRLIHDTKLRSDVVDSHCQVEQPPMTVVHAQFRERVRKLASGQGRTFGEQLVLVLERAIEHITATSKGAA
jgi:hypothetical protein